MSSKITIIKRRQQISHRPSWLHNRPDATDWPGDSNAQLEMLESIRNTLEDISITLGAINSRVQCHETMAIPRVLRKIEANTRKKPRKKKVVQP